MSSRFCSRTCQTWRGLLARPFGGSFDHNTMHSKRISKVCTCTIKYKAKEHRHIIYTASSSSFIRTILSLTEYWSLSVWDWEEIPYTQPEAKSMGEGGPSWKYVSLLLPPTPSLSSTPRNRNHKLTVKYNYILPLPYLRWKRTRILLMIYERIHIKKISRFLKYVFFRVFAVVPLLPQDECNHNVR